MALNLSIKLQSILSSPVKEKRLNFAPMFSGTSHRANENRRNKSLRCSFPGGEFRRNRNVKVFGLVDKLGKKGWREKELSDSDSDSDSDDKSAENVNEDSDFADLKERHEWRKKIREVIDKHCDNEEEEEVDDIEKRKKMQKLLADYPLVVEDVDPSWPEDAEGRGFKLDQFFDKITIKNVKKDEDDDDEKDDSEDEVVWQDDNYIRPIKDVKVADWEETVFKDISPLIVLVHNRYKRPKENERLRNELEKAVQIIWNCGLPSPRCIAVDAIVEHDLVSALQVSVFPELIFTRAGKILYRDKGIRSADELSKIMAYYYYRAGKPPCLNGVEDRQEPIPYVTNVELP